MSVPDLGREVCVFADSFTELLALTAEDVERLWSKVLDDWDRGTLRALNTSTPRHDALEIFITEDRLTMALGETVLARLAR